MYSITGNLRPKIQNLTGLKWSEGTREGNFIAYPERESVPGKY